jgi:hypothetical protein
LARRGLAVPAGLWAAGSVPIGASTAVPPALIEATTQAALQLAAGRALAGVVPASVVILTSSITRNMLMANIIKTASLLLALGVVSAGVVGLARQAPGGKDGDNAARPVAGAASRSDSEGIQGTWVMIAQETNGEEVQPDKDLKLTITADTIISTYPEGDPR